jgi:DNA polymerase-3 subunit alpha
MGAAKEAIDEIGSNEVMWHWLREGWKYRGFDKSLTKKQKKEYSDRVKYEMDLMVSKDFIDYFLVLSDVVRTAKDMGIAVGPARGSAAASLVCYLIRLTEVNPLEYPLMLFERFIAPNRNDLPDVDLDFEDERRDEVRQIMIRKYGADRVGNIGTFTRFRGKNSLDDVARVYQIPKYEVETAKGFLIERSGGDSRFDAGIEDTVDMFPQVKEIFDRYPALYNAMTLEGNYKSFGVHAAGIVVGAEPLWKYVATYRKDNVGANKTTMEVLSVDKYDGEHLGLLKLDALGLTTMGMIRVALDMLGMSLEELYDIPMDDYETLQAFKRADVVGIFQFEGRTTKMVVQQYKPENFMDLAAINALARPGPLHSGSTAEFIAIRHGQKEHIPLHPLVEKICAPTEGQIIYQEQILQICGDIGKLPWTHRDAIRRIISSKKGESAFNALWDDFKNGAAENGISEEIAAEIWKRMVTAGTYAFNIAHCISYSMLGFWAMWLKVHHPLEFYAASLIKTSQDKTGEEKRVLLMRDLMDSRFGRSFNVFPPVAGKSGMTWKTEPARKVRSKKTRIVREIEGGVRAGFLQIPGVGAKTAASIEEFDREVGIKSWEDLGTIKGIGGVTVQKAKDFAADPDPFKLLKIVNDKKKIRAFIASGNAPGVPHPTKTSDMIPYEEKPWTGVILGRIRQRILQDMFEDYRAKAGVDLDPTTIKQPELKESIVFFVEDEEGLMTVKVPRYIYPKFKDEIWNAKVNHDYILARVKKYPFLGKTIHVENMWIVDPD